MSNLRWILLAAILVGASAPAGAQIPGMFNWWDGPIAKDLKLTEEQNKQIRATVRESRDRLIKLRAEVESAEGELSDQMNEEKVDPGKAEAAIERVIKARSDLTRAVSQMSLKLRIILTTAQWQELQKREVRPRGPLRGPDGGGPGRRPPSPRGGGGIRGSDAGSMPPPGLG